SFPRPQLRNRAFSPGGCLPSVSEQRPHFTRRRCLFSASKPLHPNTVHAHPLPWEMYPLRVPSRTRPHFEQKSPTKRRRTTLAYELSPLPYDYAALEPHIDAETMKLHHDKHHQAFINNLNGAIEKHPDLSKHTAEDLLRNLSSVPEDIRTTVRNNGGGHVNHSMFWAIMKPGGGDEPTGKIAEQIRKDIGDFAAFKKQFNETTAKQFGSGWGWVIWDGG